jgi:gliding motility-associated-like protein
VESVIKKITIFEGLQSTALFYCHSFSFLEKFTGAVAANELKQMICMRNRLFIVITLSLLQSVVQAQVTPITLTGFNQDAVAEAGPSSQATTSIELDSPTPSNMVLYSQAFATFAGITGGLPDNGLISSGTDNYQLASYTGNNALLLNRGQNGTLLVSAPASYAKLRILAFSTEGSSQVNISLSFTDGTTTAYTTNYSLPDWFNGATNVVLQGMGRCKRQAAGPYTADGLPTNPRFYYIEIVLNCADRLKMLESVACSNVTPTGSGIFPNAIFLAVSGQSFTQTVLPTITPSDCNGPNGSIALNVSGSTSPYTYSWNTAPVQTGSTATGLAPGTYTCTITDAGGCPTTYTGTVPLNNNAAMTATATPAAICPGGSVQLNANVTTGTLTTYTWTPGNLSGQSVTVSPTTTTTYTVNGSNTIGCTASATVTVTVNPQPAAPVVNSTSICPGQTATLQVQNPQAGETYNWYDAATGGTLLGTGTSFTTPVLTATTTYYVEAVSAAGCNSATRTAVTVTVNALPAAPVINPALICPGDDAILTVNNPQAGFTYEWYAAASGGTPLATGTSYTVNNVTANTTVYVSATNANGCVSSTRGQGVVTIRTQLAQPVVTVTNVTFSSLTFSWSAVPGAVGYEVTTDGGATYQTPSSGATGTTHTISGLAGNTTVIIQVRALGTQPCENSILSAPVAGTTLSSKEIFVPNVFTPNNDGRNDILYVYGNYVATIQLRIFNQWGQLIFQSENISTGWDGTHKGKQQPVGVYAYTLKVVLQDGTVITKKGSVNLIR